MFSRTLPVLLGRASLALVVAVPTFVYGLQSGSGMYSDDEYPIRIALPSPADEVGLPPAVASIALAEGQVLPEAAEPTEAAAPATLADRSSRTQAGEIPAEPQRLFPDIRFDLAQVSRRGEYIGRSPSLEVRKPVNLDGAYQGEARIYVLSDSLLAINRDELSRLLAMAGKPRLDAVRTSGSETAGEVITFDDLRELGISIRYDPNGDRILVST